MLLKIKSKFSDINISFVLCDTVLNVFVFLSKTNFMHFSYILPTKQLLSCKQCYSCYNFIQYNRILILFTLLFICQCKKCIVYVCIFYYRNMVNVNCEVLGSFLVFMTTSALYAVIHSSPFNHLLVEAF